MRAAFSVAVLGLVACVAVEAAHLTDKQLESQTCTSTAFQYVSRVTVTNPPTAAVDILRFPDDVSEFRLECLQIFESLTYPALLNGNPTLQRSCAASNAAVSICIAPADATIADAEARWECSALAQYSRQPMTSTTYGAKGGPKLRVKLQWMPQLNTPQCYPRDLTVQMVAHEPSPPGSSVAASVIFILLVVAVGLGVVAFAIYQVRKSMTEQFKRAERERAIPLPPDADEKMEDGVQRALGYEPTIGDGDTNGDGLNRTYRDDVYVDHEDVAVTVTDRNEVLESRPMPKPWYARTNYRDGDAPTPQYRAESISKTYEDKPSPPSGGSVRRRGGGRAEIPAGSNARRSLSQFYDDPAPQDDRRRLAGGNSLRATDAGDPVDPEEDDETVLVCGDCALAIHDQNTPRFCEVTGMRHY